jgi:hypothetical protein
VNKRQVLAAHLDQVSHFKIGVFDAGATVRDVDENALGGLVVLALHCPADAEHKICCLLFDLHEQRCTSLLKACFYSGDILAISSPLSKESRWLTAIALNFSIRRKCYKSNQSKIKCISKSPQNGHLGRLTQW